MGTFTVPIEIGDPLGRRFESVDALVDTGASDTVVPLRILQGLGVDGEGRWPYTLADGRVVEHEIGQTVVRINGTSRTVLVVFGDSETVLLGAFSSVESQEVV